ncbi:MAG TPA: threonine synthase [Euryarchaeota archaeon]|nr:threonine synthase [Euryarchaeota archaeon]
MEREEVEIVCSSCGARGVRVGPLGTCQTCGGILTAEYDNPEARDHKGVFEGEGIWRYSSLLPIRPKSVPISLGEGGTTLLRSQRLGEILGMSKLLLKNETTNPTGCFVDRGTALEMIYARDSDYTSVACALSGNLAASVAAYGARAGMVCRAFLKSNVDLGKLYQIVAYGAKITHVTDEEEAHRAMARLGDECHPITNHSPFFLEGIKTTGLEIAEQLKWQPPDRIVISIGTGAHLAMIWRGLKELEKLGLIDASKTSMTGVQIEGCAPIVEALENREVRYNDSKISLAREIAIQHPQMTDRAIAAIRESDGTATAVGEKDMVEAVQLLARAEGIFAEPAAAASVAGLRKLIENGFIERDERVVCVITGTGLKEPIASQKALRKFAGAQRIARRMERRIRMLDIGSTKEAILRLIGSGSDYGYGIWRKLKDDSGISISVVSVYQHLSELETAELIRKERVESSTARRKRVIYGLTSKGQKFLEQNEEAPPPR